MLKCIIDTATELLSERYSPLGGYPQYFTFVFLQNCYLKGAE